MTFNAIRNMFGRSPSTNTADMLPIDTSFPEESVISGRSVAIEGVSSFHFTNKIKNVICGFFGRAGEEDTSTAKKAGQIAIASVMALPVAIIGGPIAVVADLQHKILKNIPNGCPSITGFTTREDRSLQDVTEINTPSSQADSTQEITQDISTISNSSFNDQVGCIEEFTLCEEECRSGIESLQIGELALSRIEFLETLPSLKGELTEVQKELLKELKRLKQQFSDNLAILEDELQKRKIKK